MALTADVKITRYGTDTGHQLANQPLGGSVTVYRGSIALTDVNGYLKNASSPASTDTCWGVIENSVDLAFTGPGITNPNTTNGGVNVNIATGTFFLNSGTSGDALTQANVGATVYVIDEVTVGKTSGGGTRPVAGVLMAIDTTQPGGYAVKLGNAAGNTSP